MYISRAIIGTLLTAMIWVGTFIVFTFVTSWTFYSLFALLFFAGIFGLTAMALTYGVMRFVENKAASSEPSSAAKAKRASRVDQMFNTLSEDELDVLRARLSDSDGELSLDHLLMQENRRKR